MTGGINCSLTIIFFTPDVLVEGTNVMSKTDSSKSEHYYSAIA
jgi:hypothetical protein